MVAWSLAPGRAAPMLGASAADERSDRDSTSGFARVSDSLAWAADGLAWRPSILPAVGRLSRPFSRDRLHPILHVVRPHEGIDAVVPTDAPVVAAASGVGRAIGRREGHGLVFEIDDGHDVVTRFAHLSRVAVRADKQVARTEIVARVGSSGLWTRAHLHFEVRVSGTVVGPLRAAFELSPDKDGRTAP